MNINNNGFSVSIIVCCYNSERYLKETLKSIKDQTYKKWELLIVDDLSSDNTCEKVSAFATKDKRINLIKSKELCLFSSMTLQPSPRKGLVHVPPSLNDSTIILFLSTGECFISENNWFSAPPLTNWPIMNNILMSNWLHYFFPNADLNTFENDEGFTSVL